MGLNNYFEYKTFYITKLSVDIATGIKEQRKDVEVSLGFGFAEPYLSIEQANNVAVFPFRFVLETDDVKIESIFSMGFGIKNNDISSEEKIKEYINKMSGDFTEYVNNAINEIIKNALMHTNVRFKDQPVLDPITYS